VACNFPIVAWKRVIARPLLALLLARLRGSKVVLIQHEWAGLNGIRRLTYIPALWLANTKPGRVAPGLLSALFRQSGLICTLRNLTTPEPY
jgi:hypothetical protein